MELIDLLWAVTPSVIVGIFMAFWNNGQKKHNEKETEKELDRLKAQELQISLLVATAQLSYANAMAIKRGAPNGEIEEGLEQYQEAMNKFRTFEREQLAKNVAK